MKVHLFDDVIIKYFKLEFSPLQLFVIGIGTSVVGTDSLADSSLISLMISS